jgi:L-ascorbate metabolism protein UlaG (beta-lactamase superfamily)
MIGEAYDIDMALLPIGAYDPEWFMQVSHMTPEEAVQSYLDLCARRFIPMHYGAFRLADDTTKEALGRLVKEWERRELCEEELRIMKLGETFLI